MQKNETAHLTLLIPFALFGSNSLRLEWRSVHEEQNGLKLLAEVHEEASLLESAEFYDIIDAYKEIWGWAFYLITNEAALVSG